MGGDDEERAIGLALDGDGDVYIAGYTLSSNFPTFYAYQYSFMGYQDAFAVKYTENLILPPYNFSGKKEQNRSLFQVQYINELTWAANPNNQFITKYRLYRTTGMLAYSFLAETDANTFVYLDKNVGKDTTYYYYIVAVDSTGKEGFPAYTVVY